MALIACGECQKQISDQAEVCPGCGAAGAARAATGSPQNVKERFELGIKMLEGYYQGLETRFAGSVALIVVSMGWLITSAEARKTLHDNLWLRRLAYIAIFSLLAMYGLNVRHWLRKWRKIREDVDKLNYIEPGFYKRYQLLPIVLNWLVYFIPIALLYFLIFYIIRAIGDGSLVSK